MNQKPGSGVLSARSLLHRFLDLRRLSPDVADWSEEGFSENPPRLQRLRQVVSLFRAFEIEWDPVSFLKGGFIRPESPRYAPVLEMMASTLATKGDPWPIHAVPHCFESLLEYRAQVDDVLTFSSGVIEANGLYAYPHKKIAELNRIIEDNVTLIDDILMVFISPEAREFSIDQLAHDYDFPDVDLPEIDADWI